MQYVYGACTIGGIISDIDVTTSKSHKDLIKILTISGFALVICILIEYFSGISILSYINSNDKLLGIILGIIAFLVVCIFGITKPHRSFMHSFTALILLSIIVDFIYHNATLPFAIGMLSHILLDLLNMKKVQLFYPLKNKFGLKLCTANGYANTVIFISSISIFIFELILFTANMFIEQQ